MNNRWVQVSMPKTEVAAVVAKLEQSGGLTLEQARGLARLKKHIEGRKLAVLPRPKGKRMGYLDVRREA